MVSSSEWNVLVSRIVDGDQRLKDVPLLFRLELSVVGLLDLVVFRQCSLELDVVVLGSTGFLPRPVWRLGLDGVANADRHLASRTLVTISIIALESLKGVPVLEAVRHLLAHLILLLDDLVVVTLGAVVGTLALLGDTVCTESCSGLEELLNRRQGVRHVEDICDVCEALTRLRVPPIPLARRWARVHRLPVRVGGPGSLVPLTLASLASFAAAFIILALSFAWEDCRSTRSNACLAYRTVASEVAFLSALKALLATWLRVATRVDVHRIAALAWLGWSPGKGSISTTFAFALELALHQRVDGVDLLEDLLGPVVTLF